MDGPEHVIPYDRLPPGFARAVDRPPAVPAPARPAATVVLMRKGAAGLEVLLLRRSRSAGFVPGAWVFPGGRVDPEDADASVVARLGGLDAAEAARRLELPSDAAPPAVAYYAAAVREAFEETGILVGAGGKGGPRAPDLRRALLEGEMGFAGVLEALDARVDAGVLEYVAHWITPVAEPHRYDTRFFAAVAEPGDEADPDPREVARALWIAPEEALGRNRTGELPMVFPTVRTLEGLRGFDAPERALEAYRSRRIPAVLPRLVRTPQGVGIELPVEE